MTRKNKHIFIGIVLIIVSIIVIYFNLQEFEGGFDKLWPAIILLFGMVLYIFYFSTRKKKNRLFIIFLATLIAISSVTLFVLTFTSFEHIKYLWPGFLFAFGMSILSLYFFGKKKKGTALLATLIISFSLLIWIIYSLESQFGLVIGVTMLILGAAFFTRGLSRESKLEQPAISADEPSTDEEEKTAVENHEEKAENKD
jgi:peptidoglycan/LPS O-acetylase OafA/YrhL